MLNIVRKYLAICIALVFACVLALHPQKVEAVGEFKTTWKTDNPGVSASNQIIVPTYPGLTYNYTVDWGDGSSTTGIIGDGAHTYAAPGTYQIMVTGTFPGIYFSLAGDREKILSVDQWGVTRWGAMGNAFFGCSNLTIPAVDTPDLSGVDDLTYTFRGTNFSTGLSGWNVSSIHTMIGTFQDSTFNGDISAWDMSNMVNMSALFYGDAAFNQNIGGWDVSSAMYMGYMFYNDTAFNQDISAWDVSRVVDMAEMFMGASSFNQPLNTWNVSSVTAMTEMFYGATAFNQSLSTWNVSNVTSLGSMFRYASSFNQPLSGWNTANVTDMSHLFGGATVFNQDISSWNTARVTTMDGMFADDVAFNQDIGEWNVANVTNMGYMFASSTAFNKDVSSWNVSQVTNMAYMFDHAGVFDQDLGGWNVSNVTDMTSMLASANLSNDNYNALLVGWSARPVQSSVVFSAGSSAYCNTGAHGILTGAPNSWTITDGGVRCLTELYPIPARVTIANAIYRFSASEGVEAAYASGTGAYVSEAPTCADCEVIIDPVAHTVSFSNLQIGDVLNFSISFTRTNTLRIGPSIIIQEDNGGGMPPPSIIPAAFQQGPSGKIPLAFVINGGSTTTDPRLTLSGNGNPYTIRGYVVSLDSTFAHDSIFPFNASTTNMLFTLPNVPGSYTVYFKYYSTTGIYSDLLFQTVSLVSPTTTVSEKPKTPKSAMSTALCKGSITLRQGGRGSQVKELQRFLQAQGSRVYPEGIVSGFFGPATKRAVTRFQEMYATDILKPLSLKRGTGIVQQGTRKKMCALGG